MAGRWAIIGLAVLGLLAACNSSAHTAASDSTMTTVPTTVEAPTTTTTMATTTTTAAPKRWIKVATFNGSGGQATGRFQLATGEGRITYHVPSADDDFGWYLYEPGGAASVEHVDCVSSCSGTGFVNVQPGTYYLKVITISTAWTIVVEENR